MLRPEFVISPLLAPPPDPRCLLCVVIPARDEARRIGATIQALATQFELSGRPLDHRRYEVMVLANNCRDDTAAVARHAARRHPTLRLHVLERTFPAAVAHVGTARRLLMDTAWARLSSLRHGRGVVATTDADTIVDPTWVAAMLYEVACGADAVGGNILTSRSGRDELDSGTQAFHVQDVAYKRLLTAYAAHLAPDPHDPWPRHYHHTGASLAVTTRAYHAVGGLPPLRSGEDVALYQALVSADARVRHSPLVRVTTSTRQVGRASAGMADTLLGWQTMAQHNQTLLVEPAATSAQLLHDQRQLRALWQQFRSTGLVPAAAQQHLAAQLGLDAPYLEHALTTIATFGLLLQRLSSDRQQPAARVPVRQAIAELRARLQPLRRAS